MMWQVKLYVVLLSYWILFCFYNVYYLTKPTRQDSLQYFNSYLLRRKPLDRDEKGNYTHENLIDTPGCVIPRFEMEFEMPEPSIKQSCGRRAVTVGKIEDHRIKFTIHEKAMNVYTRSAEFECCYRYASRSTQPGKEDTEITYSICVPFRNGTEATLEREVINVICRSGKRKKVFYEDSYAIVKKIVRPERSGSGRRWNVLIIGMDTMSRLRVTKTMPRTVKYLKRHKWLDFRGYNKIGRNTLPNLMAILTGMKYSTVYKRCAKGVTNCNDLMMWRRFEETGYVTAYGEDYISLPDTFNRLRGFRVPPTHHYLRPLYLTGEKLKGHHLCTKTLPSASHILNYASDFVRTYTNDSFFGFFWMNSYSHNFDSFPTLIDSEFVNFLENIRLTIKHTIVIFVSDHGIRFGPSRHILEAYYEERLPMFFMWLPKEFRNANKEAYAHSINNQYILTTPYDLHITLSDILKRNGDRSTAPISAACWRSSSLFASIPRERTCSDAGVDKKWCTCHPMQEVDARDPGALHSLDLTIKHLQDTSKKVKTKGCTACYGLQLAKVSRIHFYMEKTATYYVVVLYMSPENIGYEAVIEKDGYDYRVQDPIETISQYNKYADCVSNSMDAMYCVCTKVQCGLTSH